MLTLFQYDLADLYYSLFYGHPGHSGHPWFLFQYDLIPTLHRHFDAENWGNFLLYLPYGVLYPLFRPGSSFWRTVAAGLLTSVVIELLQPVFGRSFDINDIILNGLGVLLSAAVFFGVRALRRRRKYPSFPVCNTARLSAAPPGLLVGACCARTLFRVSA